MRDFWMKVFVAAIGCGLSDKIATERADKAVEALAARDFTDELLKRA